MKNFGLNFVAIGATWLLVGMILGIVMGAKQDFQMMPVHAHINLIGFACHSIFGIVYLLLPKMNSSRLAPYQFWIFAISTPITLLGLIFTLTGGPELPTIAGSLGVLAGATLFCIMIWQTRAATA